MTSDKLEEQIVGWDHVYELLVSLFLVTLWPLLFHYYLCLNVIHLLYIYNSWYFLLINLLVVLPFQKELCVWPGMGQLCLRKNLLYGFMRLFSMPFKTLRSVSRTVGGVSNFCSITNMSNSLQIELVSHGIKFHYIYS